jgi:hypothetical protein
MFHVNFQVKKHKAWKIVTAQVRQLPNTICGSWTKLHVPTLCGSRHLV